MSFSPHVNNITSNSTSNAIKSLNFVRRNLHKCDESIKSAAYLGLICPILEYASAVWDPHLLIVLQYYNYKGLHNLITLVILQPPPI